MDTEPLSILQPKLIDLNDENEIEMRNHEKMINSFIGNRTNHSEISRILIEKRTSKLDPNQNQKILLGILNVLLTTENPSKFNNFFQVLQIMTRDSFELIVQNLENIASAKFHKMTINAVMNLIVIVRNFIQLKSVRLDNLLIIMLRQIVIEDSREKMMRYSQSLIQLIDEKIDWVQTNFQRVELLFAKYLRILSYVIPAENQTIIQPITHSLKILWKFRKEDCIKLGREFIRLMIDIFKAKEIDFITSIIKDPYKDLSSLFSHLISQKEDTIPSSEVSSMMIPVNIHEMLNFQHQSLSTENIDRYFGWIIKELNIEKKSPNEFIFADICRLLLTNIAPTKEAIQNNFCQRWQTLHLILKITENNLAKSMIKKSIFFDWIFYSSQGGEQIFVVEPGILLISNLFYLNIQLCEEIIDFLFLFAEQFNPSMIVEIKDSLRQVFGDAINYKLVQSFDDLIYSEKIDLNLREKIYTYIPSNQPYQIEGEEQISQPAGGLNKIDEPYDPFDRIDPEGEQENNLNLGQGSPEIIDEENPFDNKETGQYQAFEGQTLEFNPDGSSKYSIQPYDPLMASQEYEKDDDQYQPDLGEDFIADELPEELQQLSSKLQLDKGILFKFRKSLTKILSENNLENFESFLKDFFFQIPTSSSRDTNNYYQNFAAISSHFYKKDFDDLLLDDPRNSLNYMLNHLRNSVHETDNLMETLKQLFLSMNATEDNLSTIFLNFCFEQGIQNHNFKKLYTQFSQTKQQQGILIQQDLSKLFAALTQKKFNKLMIYIIKDFDEDLLAAEDGAFLKFFLEISDEELIFEVDYLLSQSLIQIFATNNIGKILLKTFQWNSYLQQVVWRLLSSQFAIRHGSKLIEVIGKIVETISQSVAKSSKDISFYPALNGFKQFIMQSLSSRDENWKLGLVIELIDLPGQLSHGLHSMFDMFDLNLVRTSIKEYIKYNEGDASKMEKLANHIKYLKSKQYVHQNKGTIMEDHLYGLLIKKLSVHNLQHFVQ